MRLDEARNLIDTSVAKNPADDVLVVNFVRQIQTDDASFDVDIGNDFGRAQWLRGIRHFI